MLILTRKKGERILIGDNIAIIVLNIRRGTVQIGIDIDNESYAMWANEQETVDLNTRGDVYVTVLYISRYHVKLGIDAHDDVKILREELKYRS